MTEISPINTSTDNSPYLDRPVVALLSTKLVDANSITTNIAPYADFFRRDNNSHISRSDGGFIVNISGGTSIHIVMAADRIKIVIESKYAAIAKKQSELVSECVQHNFGIKCHKIVNKGKKSTIYYDHNASKILVAYDYKIKSELKKLMNKINGKRTLWETS